MHNPDDFTDISLKATFGNIFVAAEEWDDRASTDNDTTLIHIGGKVAGFKWDIAQIENDIGAFGLTTITTYMPGLNANEQWFPIVDSNGEFIDEACMMTDIDRPQGACYTSEQMSQPGFTVYGSDRAGNVGDYLPSVLNGKPVIWSSTTETALFDTDSHATGKLAPLGSMLIGKNARGNTATAVANVADFTKILGIALSTELAGNTVKVIYTKSTLGDSDKMTGTELIISRPLSSGATLTANIGKISGISDSTKSLMGNIKGNATNTGLRLDVRF